MRKGLNEFQINNLKTHIDFLRRNAEAIRKEFTMRMFLHDCGTPACSLGFAMLSVGLPRQAFGGFSNVCRVTEEYFGVRGPEGGWHSSPKLTGKKDEYDHFYLFSGLWSDINNTPEAAAARMEAFLYDQVPYWDYTPEFAHPIVKIEVEELELELVC